MRLNRSKPLNGAEIRNAMSGEVPAAIRAIADHPFFRENINFNVSRAVDSNASAKILLFEYEEKPVSTKKKDLDNFARNNHTNNSKLYACQRIAIDYLDIMQSIFLPQDELLSSAGPIPIYYWLIKSTSVDDWSRIREFLLYFEVNRKRAREEKFNDSDTPFHKNYSTYDALNRSVNDVGSHVGRFDILMEEFENWKSFKIATLIF